MLILPLFIVLAGPWPPAHPGVPGPAAVVAADSPAVTLGPAAFHQDGPRVWEAHVGHVRNAEVVGLGLVADQILVEDSEHGLSALDPATGELRWFVQLPGRLDLWPAPGDGALVLCCGTDMLVVDSHSGHRLCHISTASIAADSPVSDGRLAYIPSVLGDRLLAVDLDTGVTDWEFRMGSGFTAPALLVGDVARRSVIVTCEDGSLRSVPAGLAVPATERWVTRIGRLAGPPVTDGKRVYLNTAARAVFALDAGVGSVAWRSLPGDPLVGKPVLGGGLVFDGTSTHLMALDAATGALRWQRTPADRPLDAGPGFLLVARGDGSALLDPADGHELQTGLPGHVFLAGDLLVELQPDSSLLATRLLR